MDRRIPRTGQHAALGGTLPELAWLYFGLGQLPIYLLPWMLKPVATRLAAERDARDPGHIAPTGTP